jgi:hypothetical protein
MMDISYRRVACARLLRARADRPRRRANLAIVLMKSRRRIAFPPDGSGVRRLSLTGTRLQQGFATGEMGFGVKLHSSNRVRPRNVRFTPKSRHRNSAA